MTFRVFASFCFGDGFSRTGWHDYEILVHSNSKDNARRKIWNWAKRKGAVQRQIQFVDKEMWKSQKCYKTTIIR